MLVEIACDRFRSKMIPFHDGLNVVLGDDNATNSIGKSALLMVIDFAFGGLSLIQYNTDIVSELGHHDYVFTFSFEGERYRFRRGTFSPDLVYKLDEEGVEGEPIDVEEYTALLKAGYGINIEEITFRALVGLYSRVWGKDNLNVHRPLHAHQQQSDKTSVDNLIRTFDRYGRIATVVSELAVSDAKHKALQKALDKRVIPKIGKAEYRHNQEQLEKIESEIEEIKRDLAKFATNIAELGNREVLDLKFEKDELLGIELKLESKLRRVNRNLAENRHIQSKNLENLRSFFPSVNATRLADIEEFHDGLAKILKTELQGSRAELQKELGDVRAHLRVIDDKLAVTLRSLDNPGIVVDRVFDLTTRLQVAKNENEYFDSSQQLAAATKGLRRTLSEERAKILRTIEDVINDKLRRVVTTAFGADHKSPEIDIGESSYSYEIFEDTGAGVAYGNLIVFDLVIFMTTVLPIVIHDSVLFKNIENAAVANLLELYGATDKQSFIAIDEVGKYGRVAEQLLREKAVIQLSNAYTLFDKDWRKARGLPSPRALGRD